MPRPLPQLGPAPPRSLTAVLAALPDPRHPLGWRPELVSRVVEIPSSAHDNQAAAAGVGPGLG
jgi:hypothetical protein